MRATCQHAPCAPMIPCRHCSCTRLLAREAGCIDGHAPQVALLDGGADAAGKCSAKHGGCALPYFYSLSPLGNGTSNSTVASPPPPPPPGQEPIMVNTGIASYSFIGGPPNTAGVGTA